MGQGAVLGLQGGTDAVHKTLAQVESQWGNLSDVVGVWLQDWTGQRVFSGPKDLPRTGLWWNWEVSQQPYSILYMYMYMYNFKLVSRTPV